MRFTVLVTAFALLASIEGHRHAITEVGSIPCNDYMHQLFSHLRIGYMCSPIPPPTAAPATQAPTVPSSTTTATTSATTPSAVRAASLTASTASAATAATNAITTTASVATSPASVTTSTASGLISTVSATTSTNSTSTTSTTTVSVQNSTVRADPVVISTLSANGTEAVNTTTLTETALSLEPLNASVSVATEIDTANVTLVLNVTTNTTTSPEINTTNESVPRNQTLLDILIAISTTADLTGASDAPTTQTTTIHQVTSVAQNVTTPSKPEAAEILPPAGVETPASSTNTTEPPFLPLVVAPSDVNPLPVDTPVADLPVTEAHQNHTIVTNTTADTTTVVADAVNVTSSIVADKAIEPAAVSVPVVDVAVDTTPVQNNVNVELQVESTTNANAELLPSSTTTAPGILTDPKCNFIWVQPGCEIFNNYKCPIETVFDFTYCVCNHVHKVDKATCRSPVPPAKPPTTLPAPTFGIRVF